VSTDWFVPGTSSPPEPRLALESPIADLYEQDDEQLDDVDGEYEVYGEYEDDEGPDRETELVVDEEAEPGPPFGETSSAPVRQRLRTQQLRDAWAAYVGRKDLMRQADLLGHRPLVNPQTVEAVAALGRALAATGYTADGVGGYSKRKIKTKQDGRIQDTGRWSLHSYGLALDIDAAHNPHRHGEPGPARWSTASDQAGRRSEVAAGRADTSFAPGQIAAAEAIRTVDGHRVFFWAGHWRRSPDAMHFQLDVTPEELARGLAPPGASEAVEESFVFDALKALWRKPTVGFEFDVHYGILPALVPVGVAIPAQGATVSDHTWATDGFKVKRDGARLEINTQPFETTADGKAELGRTVTRITTFAEELADGCRKATPSPIVVPGVTGAPRPFLHPRITGVPIVKLPVSGAFTNCSVWAAPQATLTIPLAKVATLVQRIKASEDRGAGKALTGGSSARMGLRSEALYRALHEVRRARTAQTFSADVEGLLILLASYLWTSELPYRFPAPGVPARPGEDYEPFGKSYLPINVKTPFSQVFDVLLSSADQRVFRDRFADGAARVNLFRLALPNGATATDGDRVLLPTGPMDGGVSAVHTRQNAAFGRVPTWNDLVDHTLDRTLHGWGDRLLVPLSSQIDVANTRPRVALELRRIGFASVDRSLWPGLMAATFEMTRDLSR
jgi:hypothetical protein